jgi:hypothetical protein
MYAMMLFCGTAQEGLFNTDIWDAFNSLGIFLDGIGEDFTEVMGVGFVPLLILNVLVVPLFSTVIAMTCVTLGAVVAKKHKILASFGDGTTPPDGWALFYAYKQLVLSACLFRLGKQDEAWENFDQALESYRYILSLDQEWLDVGGLLFSDLRVSKDWNYAIDKQGNKHKLFGTVRLSFYHLYQIRSLLTSPSWAWFNSVRDSEKFRAAVEWVKAEEAKQDAEEE